MRIGIDFGGVLARPQIRTRDSRTQRSGFIVVDMPRAVESLSWLKEEGHSLHLVSARSHSHARHTHQALRRAGLLPLFDSINFVKRRSHKGQVCLQLGLQAIIDDRPDVLSRVRRDTQGLTHPIRIFPFEEQPWPRVLRQILELEEKINQLTQESTKK